MGIIALMKDTKRDITGAYEKLYGHSLTPEEVREADDNLFGFLALLCEIDQSLKSQSL